MVTMAPLATMVIMVNMVTMITMVTMVTMAVFPSGSVLTDPGPFYGPFCYFGSVWV